MNRLKAMSPLAKLTGAILSEVFAVLCLKASDGLTQPVWLLPMGVGYTSSFWFLAQVLDAGMPLGVAYGTWAAVGVVLTALFGTLLFDERLTLVMGVGIALLTAGVLLVHGGSPEQPADVASRTPEEA